MSVQSERRLLIEAYRIIEKAQSDEIDLDEVSDWLARVEEDSPNVAQLASDFDPDMEEYAEEVDEGEIGT